MERIGFKEWSAVCQAIACGRQTLIIRKGGLAEGPDGFAFKHREFYLFPTWFHEEAQKITESWFSAAPDSEGSVNVRCFVTLEWAGVITDRAVAMALAPFHILREEVVSERFEYKDAPGVHVAFVRASRVVPPWTFPNEKRFGGCRSWVELPERDDMPLLQSALSEAEFARRREEFFKIAQPAD